MARASFGVATSSESASRMVRMRVTCSALLLRKLALADIDAESSSPTRTLPPMIAAHADEGQQLVAAGREHRPVVLVAEQLVGDALHVDDVLRIGADAAEDAEDRLHEQRRLDEAALEEMGEGVEMADVVALELEARAAAFAQAPSSRHSMSLKVLRKMKSRRAPRGASAPTRISSSL